MKFPPKKAVRAAIDALDYTQYIKHSLATAESDFLAVKVKLEANTTFTVAKYQQMKLAQIRILARLVVAAKA